MTDTIALPPKHILVLTNSLEALPDLQTTCEPSQPSQPFQSFPPFQSPQSPVRYYFCSEFQTLEDVYKYGGICFSDMMILPVPGVPDIVVPEDVMDYLISRIRTVI